MRTVVFLWLGWCVYFTCVGWLLSAVHQLNPTGYVISLILALVVFFVWFFKKYPAIWRKPRIRKFYLRFRQPLPAIFLMVAAAALIGGAIYPPSNYDALTYRLPRMLNWLAAGHWVWIPTVNDRMNFSATAWEWAAMPFFAVLRSDRGLFFINAVGFLLMPGLLFSVFRRLGIARRTAWAWMWILPLAYGYATQAGGVGNDLNGTLFALISVHYGLRARDSGNVKEIWLAVLAAALMTGTKISNLPLLLPCLVAVWPTLPRLRRQWLASAVVAAVALLISAAPTMTLNQINTGSWNGDPHNLSQIQIKNPGAAFFGNGILLAQHSFMPPVLPDAHRLNDWLNEKMPASWRRTLAEKFPRYSLNRLNELPQEETAGLGLGVTSLLLATGGAAMIRFMRKRLSLKISLVGLAAWIAMLVFMLKMGSEATARLLLPYYPLASVPLLLLPAQNRLLNFRRWKVIAALAAASALPVVILSPSRPLWPALSVSGWLRQHSDKPATRRIVDVYFGYAHRNDLLAPLRAALPSDARNIGFLAGGNDTDYSLWRPFGFRRVEYLQIAADKSISVPGDVEWIVVKRVAWTEATDVPLESWAVQHHAKITLSVPIVTLVAWGEQTWCVLRIEKP